MHDPRARRFRIVAYNAGGNSPASNVASASVAGGTLNPQTIYATNCASCHGSNREGTGTNPPLTTAALASKSFDQLNQTIAGGTANGMPGFQSQQVFVISYEDRNVDALKHQVDYRCPAFRFRTKMPTLISGHRPVITVSSAKPFGARYRWLVVQNYKLVYGSIPNYQ
jgi:cytochrome c553